MSESSTNPLRRALRAMTHGMYVLSVRHQSPQGPHDEYVVIALAMQCSVEPARVAMSVSVNSRILDAFRSAGSGVLSVLGTGQLAAIRKYGTPGGVRNVSAQPVRSASGHPIPPEGAFWLGVSFVEEFAAGDHVLFVADVIEAGVQEAGVPHAGASAATFEPLTLASSRLPYAG